APTIDAAVRPIVDAGLADFVEPDHKLCDGVRLVPTAGHTPGHVSVEISSQGERALITGDMTHHPVQWAEPDWKMPADVDSAAADLRCRRPEDALQRGLRLPGRDRAGRPRYRRTRRQAEAVGPDAIGHNLEGDQRLGRPQYDLHRVGRDREHARRAHREAARDRRPRDQERQDPERALLLQPDGARAAAGRRGGLSRTSREPGTGPID